MTMVQDPALTLITGAEGSVLVAETRKERERRSDLAPVPLQRRLPG